MPQPNYRPTPAVDPDDLQRVLDSLAEQHGALEVLPANRQTGSVNLIAEDGSMFRFTTQSRLIFVGRGPRPQKHVFAGARERTS